MPILQEILVEQLKDLLHAEGQLVKALPKMARAANDPKLKEAFRKHLEETKNHVERLKPGIRAPRGESERQAMPGNAGTCGRRTRDD